MTPRLARTIRQNAEQEFALAQIALIMAKLKLKEKTRKLERLKHELR
jgi:hypothetical protein